VVIASRYGGLIYDDISEVPNRDVALVLGTAKAVNGRINLYYRARIDAAYQLYKHGKVNKLLVSGDNSLVDYNEPLEMKDDLVALGVAEDDVYLDYAGFRTLDSVVRAREVFGLDKFIVVSQKFHCERALFIAKSRGIAAIGFAARDVHSPLRYRVLAREFFARAQAGLDIWVTNKGPKYLGDKIQVLD
jgi:SanA protein